MTVLTQCGLVKSWLGWEDGVSMSGCGVGGGSVEPVAWQATVELTMIRRERSRWKDWSGRR